VGRGPGIRLRVGLTRPRPGWAGVLCAALLVMTVSCADAPVPALDIEAIEAEVPGLLVPTHPELVLDVDCGDPDPDGLGPIACTAILSGMEIPVVVHRPAIDGQIRVKSPVVVVDAVEVAAEVAERLESDLGVPNLVVCVPAVRVAAQGEQFSCSATDPGGRTISLMATLLGRDGSFRVDLDLP